MRGLVGGHYSRRWFCSFVRFVALIAAGEWGWSRKSCPRKLLLVWDRYYRPRQMADWMESVADLDVSLGAVLG
jgi:hypothetical protein